MPAKQTKLFRIGIRMAPDQKPQEHLVRAGSLAQAKEHVTKDMVHGEVASQEDLVRLVQSGVKVVDANAETEPTPPPAKSAAKK